MDSNTANNSANESVKTRPKWKAYLDFIKEFLKNNQEKAALLSGYALVALLFFNLGTFTIRQNPPNIKIQEPSIDLTEVYNTLKLLPNQFAAEKQGEVAGAATDLNCTGKIKGNIGSSGKIYHLPGGAFYKRTIAELCFDTEAEAQAVGFRKSTR